MTPIESEHLQSACDKLEIKNVLLSESKTMIKDDFSAEDYKSESIGLQRFNTVIGHGYTEETKEYVFKFSAGIRLVPKEKAEESNKNISDEFSLLEVKAKFNLIYSAKEALTEEEAKIFSEQNCIFNVWPYWREFVQQSCLRMGAPNLPIPLLRHKNTKE